VSATRVTTVTITCDTCGKSNATEGANSYAARFAVTAEGWHYAQGRLPGPGTKGQREFDYCPGCWPTSPHATGEL
jgi:hypothetical protein